MSTPVVPAWKKLGLKVKEDIQKDPLTGQVQAAVAGSKPATNDNKKRSADSSAENEDLKKPPKRVKLPKAERKAPPESDNLVYLRQYNSDRANWKFSKQKQNWILKNIYEISLEYVEFLMGYLKGLQGGARERVTQESFEVITNWNEYMKLPAEPTKDVDGDKKESDDSKQEENTTATKDNSDNKTTTNKTDKKEDAPPPPPNESKARRAQQIFNLLTGNLVPLELLEDEDSATTTTSKVAPPAEEKQEVEKKQLESEKSNEKIEDKGKNDKKDKEKREKKKDKKKKSHK